MAGRYYHAVGRRKTSVARVWMKEGSGKIVINKKSFEEYFPLETWRVKVLQPLKAVDKLNQFDIYVNVSGGGTTGQCEAIRHAIARALVIYDERLRPTLRKMGYLTRDPRMVERKKYGKKKARKSPQWTKR